MEVKKQQPALLAILAIAANCCYGEPAQKAEKKPSEKPGKEMLEFLANFDKEFDGIDEEEFELLVSYAKKDSSRNTEDDTEKSTGKQ